MRYLSRLRYLLVGCLALLALLSGMFFISQPNTVVADEFVSVLVVLDEDAAGFSTQSVSAKRAAIAAKGASVISSTSTAVDAKTMSDLPIVSMKVPASEVAALEAHPDVKSVSL